MSTGLSNASSVKQTANSLANAAKASSSSASGDIKARKAIADNFDAFLSLLTTQLKNQSPLDPLDANQFTQQLVQFSGVEQQLKTNDLLSAMAKNIGGGGNNGGAFNAASAASLIGMQVAADGGTQRLTTDGLGGYTANYPVKTQANYSNYQVSIANSKGEVVYTAPWNPGGAGDKTFSWNGRRNNGVLVDTNEKYSITVSGELDNGQKSRMLTERTGVVKSVDLAGAEPMVQFGDMTLPLSQIKKVSKVGV